MLGRCWCSLIENYGVIPPVVLGYVLTTRVDPLQMLDELNVGDLGPAGQHQILTRPDLLAARGQDPEVRLRGSPVMSGQAACNYKNVSHVVFRSNQVVSINIRYLAGTNETCVVSIN